MMYWFFKTLVIGPWLRILFRPWVEGLENVPKDGGAIMVSNHVSFSDSFFLPLVVPRHIAFLAKSEYFTGKGIKGWLTKSFFAGVGQVPGLVRPHCERVSASCGLVAYSGFTQKARVLPMAPCFAGARVLLGWPWNPRCRSSQSP